MNVTKVLWTLALAGLIAIAAFGWSVSPQQSKSPSPTSGTKLSAPLFSIANADGVGIILTDRECDKTYTIYRSSDGSHWDRVGSAIFAMYELKNDWKDCENSYFDSRLPKNISKFFYKYSLVTGNSELESEVGIIELDQE